MSEVDYKFTQIANEIDRQKDDYDLLKQFDKANHQHIKQIGGKNKKTFYGRVDTIYKQRKLQMKKLYDLHKQYTCQLVQDANDTSIIILFDNSQSILRAEYELAGIYNPTNMIWYWGWNTDYHNRALTKTSEVTKQFAEYLRQHNTIKYSEAEDLYFRVNNGNLYTEDLLKMAKLSLYLTDSHWIIPIIRDNDRIITFQGDLSAVPKDGKIEILLIKRILQRKH